MKIGLCGTVSVGKTTLINSLSELPEFKDYKKATERSKYLRDLGIPLNTDSTLKGQTVFLAERASELFHDNLLTDRTVIDVMAFSSMSTSMNSLEKENFEEYAKNFIKEYDYIFYVSPIGVDIENNGVRETNEQYRNDINFSIKILLEKNQHRIKNFYTLIGSNEERIKKLLKVISL